MLIEFILSCLLLDLEVSGVFSRSFNGSNFIFEVLNSLLELLFVALPLVMLGLPLKHFLHIVFSLLLEVVHDYLKVQLILFGQHEVLDRLVKVHI